MAPQTTRRHHEGAANYSCFKINIKDRNSDNMTRKMNKEMKNKWRGDSGYENTLVSLTRKRQKSSLNGEMRFFFDENEHMVLHLKKKLKTFLTLSGMRCLYPVSNFGWLFDNRTRRVLWLVNDYDSSIQWSTDVLWLIKIGRGRCHRN